MLTDFCDDTKILDKSFAAWLENYTGLASFWLDLSERAAMISTPPARMSVLCCIDNIWQMVAYPLTGQLVPPSAMWSDRERKEHVTALETANHVLRREVQTVSEQARFQLAEMEHRLKNVLATVHALASQSARAGDTGDAFRVIFGARLRTLAHSHDLLRSGSPDGAPLTAVVGRCLQPYDGATGRITVSGPEVHLPARAVPTLGLAFHELATNAAKYGALSIPEGRVDVTWALETRAKDQAPSVAIIWQERGGPAVKVPERRGFGSRLLEQGLAQGAGGTTQLDFAPHGLDCRIWLPLTSDQGRT